MQNSKRAAFLWDESFLWGVMAYEALKDCELSFDLIRCEDIKNGGLKGRHLLFVPGGWASNKMKALGEAGVEEIRRFVNDGGSYLGFCGGAGLATSDGIGLLPVKRVPTRDRVPSFSGRIMLNIADNHLLWEGIDSPVFHAWWPSQFLVENGVSIPATYGKAMPDSFSSDLNVGDTEANAGWAELERAYQINLDPARLLNEPAVIEGKFGSGKVILSLIHFDTPGDRNGARVLRNIWIYLCQGEEYSGHAAAESGRNSALIKKNIEAEGMQLAGLESAVADLISLGQRNFLWYWRSPLLLQWRRGVRGLEYCTLFVLIRKIAELLSRNSIGQPMPEIGRRLSHIGELLYPFVEKAGALLVRERFAMQNANITYKRCDDSEIQRLREDLFSGSKSYGGPFKALAHELDELLYSLLTAEKRLS